MNQVVSSEEPPSPHHKTKRKTFTAIHLLPRLKWAMSTFAFVFLCSAGFENFSHAQAFTYTDKDGVPQLTDDFYVLPQKERARLMRIYDKRAAEKYTPTEIDRMKISGNWPPLDIMANKYKKTPKAKTLNYKALQKAARKMRIRITTQRTALNKEKKHVKTRLPQVEKQIQNLKNQEMAAHTKDVVNRSVGKGGFLHKLKMEVQALNKEKATLMKMKNGGLRQKERRINQGVLVYRD